MTAIGWSWIVALAPIVAGAAAAMLTHDVLWLCVGVAAHVPAYAISRDMRQDYWDQQGN